MAGQVMAQPKPVFSRIEEMGNGVETTKGNTPQIKRAVEA